MICVSDHLPVSDDNRILLPLCENNKILWLPLLVKGLLRIFTLFDEFNQFNTITCLTGWSCIQANCQKMSKEDVWSSILSHSSNAFVDTDEKSKNKKIIKHTAECFPVKTDEGVQCHRDKIISRYEVNPPKSIVIAITLSPTIIKQNKSNSLSRYPQPIILNNVKMVKNKSLPTWKQYRWTKWAMENNIIKQHEVADFTRLVNIYAPCTVSLKQSCPLMKMLNEYSLKSSENEIQYELDFSYLEPFATYIEFYVKNSQAFPFVKSIFFRNEENQTDDIHLTKNSTLSKNNNCCVYLHFESPYCESMLFTLSVCKNYTIHNGGIVPDAFSNQKTIDCSFINVEQFYWYETKISTPLSSVRTRGVSNDLVKFEPGINVLKVWGELPDKYSLTVESTVIFSVHQTVQTIYEKLTDQPKSLASFIVPMKHTFLQLCATEPSTSDRGQKLLQFYHSFMPPCVNQENELKKIERYSTMSKYIQTAIVEWIESKFFNDFHGMVEAYADLQEIFQNKSLGKQQISDLNKRLKSQHPEETALNKKKILQKVASTKKSLAKWKSQSNKLSSSTSPSKQFKSSTLKTVQGIHGNMIDILSNLLNSGKLDFDEYYLKNDFLSVGVNIIYEEITEKQINPLLLFQLNLNTHSKHELAPSIINLTNENNNDHLINLTLIDNDTQLEVRPKNIDTNMFMVNRTTKGYTLLGWFSHKKTDDKHRNYKLEFFGRPYQILHACGTRKDHFYKFGTTVCDNLSQSNYMTKHVKNKFYKPNTSNLLARVLLKVDNAALYTIYCYIENLEALEVEIRVVDENDSSIVFALSRARGKTALIPVVFLDPHFDKSQTYSSTDDTEKSINAIFVIEVILIKNIEIDYINTQDQSSDYDWTIACTYDQKITEISLETDTSMNNFQFFNPIPHQMIIKDSKIVVRTKQDKFLKSQYLITVDNIIKNNTPELNLNHHQILESMMIKQDEDLKQKLMNNNNLESFTSQLEKENYLKNTINELFDEKIFTEYVIKKNLDLMAGTHQIMKEDSYKHVLQLHKIPIKSTTSVNVKHSSMVKKKMS